MSAVKSDRQVIAEGRYEVHCTYFDASKANYSAELDVNAALQTYCHNWKTLEDAKQNVIRLRRHAAHSQTVALLGISITNRLDSAYPKWEWAAK